MVSQRCAVSVACLLFAALCLGLAHVPATAQTSGDTTLLVGVVAAATGDDEAALVLRHGGTLRSRVASLRLLVIDVATPDADRVAAAYGGDPLVRYVELEQQRRAEGTPSDPLYAGQWALPRIGWDLVFGATTPRGAATVAILDTGVDARHPDLAGVVTPGSSMLDGSDATTDPSGHGTWLAGIVAARTDTAPLEGIAGVAYAGVRVLPIAVLDAEGNARDAHVINGIVRAVESGADVILMAFSSTQSSRGLQDAIDYAWSRGVVLVAAVGNDGAHLATFPAGHRGVIGVAATDVQDRIAPFSNSGPAVFLAAPGADIHTTEIGGAYVVVSGTSTAAAIVAGVAGFMKAADPTLDNGVIVGRLARTADPAGSTDETGNGRVNMARALADTSTDRIQPAGVAPTGDGGPFVGPYVEAAGSFDYTPKTQSLTASAGGPAVAFTQTVVAPRNNGSFTASLVVAPTGTSPLPASWVSTSPATLGFVTTPSAGDTKSWSVRFTVPAGTTAGSYTAQIKVAASVSGIGQGAGTAVTVTIADSTPPVLSLPGALTVEATSAAGAVVSYGASATDDTDGPVTPSCAPPSGSTFALGATTVSCSATDSSGNTASGSFTVTVQDTTPPVLTLPSPITLEATGPAGAAATFTASATDLVDGVRPVTCNPASGATLPLGTTTVSCSASDTRGNTASGQFTITVHDTTPPVLTLPSTITVVSPGMSMATVTFTTSATDLVSGATAVSCTPASGATFPIGATTVTCSSTDAAGNTAAGSFLVQVVYDFSGFFRPIENAPLVNAARAGSAIPVKFSLKGNQGLSIFAAGFPASGPIACGATATADTVQEADTAGSSALTYDATADQYQYVWKTDKAWAGTCRQLVVRFADGSVVRANFTFRAR